MVNLFALIVGGVLLVSVSGQADSASPAHSIIIRLYDAFGTSNSRLQGARSTAEAILRQAGIESAWRECRSARGAAAKSDDSCADELSGGEVVVRIVSAPPTWPSRLSFGFSYVDAETRRGTLATVFADRISSVAVRLRANVGQLLGRVIAHEVGHLLLGTSRHSANGLMRAHWTDDVMQRDDRRDWLFSGAEVTEIRRLLLARAHGTAEATHVARLKDEPTR